jgi:hypothetical protein
MYELARLIGWDGATAIGTAVLALLGIGTVWYAKRQLQDFRKESRIKHLNETHSRRIDGIWA